MVKIMNNSFRYPWAKPYVGHSERQFLLDAFDSQWLSEGFFISQFEEQFAEAIQAKYALTTSNGTSALHLALLGLGFGPGDEVLLPGYCFAAAANMVLAVGAAPVFVDVCPDTWNIDPERLREHITAKTKAVILVHNYGNVSSIEPVLSVVRQFNLKIIEDAAEAAFSKYQGRYAGTWGDVGCFSFQAAKTLSTGEGGMVVTADQALVQRMRIIRSHGMDPKKRYFHQEAGFNFRLTNLQAALGCAQLGKMDFICEQRQWIAAQYRRYLAGEEAIALQTIAPEVDAVLWTNAFEIKGEIHPSFRQEMSDQLQAAGIETRPGFSAFHRMPMYPHALSLEVSDRLADHVVCLPTYIGLTRDDIDYICTHIKRTVNRAMVHQRHE